MKQILNALIIVLALTNIRFAQDGPLIAAEGEKKVITSGYGKNPDEALTQALRNAVEEAVGTYMTSTTRIENDDIIEDKILSLSRGFIKDFKKLAEMKVDGETKVTVAVIVTKTQILETLKASGVEVEIKGGLFFQQYAQEEQQIEDEAKVVEEFARQLPLDSPFDYSLEYGTPVKQSDSKFKIPLTVLVKTNQNYSNHYTNLKNFLNEISVESRFFKAIGMANIFSKEALAEIRDYWPEPSSWKLIYRELSRSAFYLDDKNTGFVKNISQTEFEKITQRYESRYIMEGREYVDIFEISEYSPYTVFLIEDDNKEPTKDFYIYTNLDAYRLLSKHSINALKKHITQYFYQINFDLIVHTETVLIKSRSFEIKNRIIKSIGEDKDEAGVHLFGDEIHHYKLLSVLAMRKVSFKDNTVTQSPTFNSISCISNNLIKNDEYLKIKYDIFVTEEEMKSMNKLEVKPGAPLDKNWFDNVE